MAQDFYPLYLDEGELTFAQNGEIISPITKVNFTGFPSEELTVDFYKQHLMINLFQPPMLLRTVIPEVVN